MEKRHPTLKKLQEKVSQRFLLVLGVLNNILKVLKKSSARNMIFSQNGGFFFKINVIFEKKNLH